MIGLITIWQFNKIKIQPPYLCTLLLVTKMSNVMVLVESSLSMRKSILAAYWFIRCLLLLRRATATCKLNTLVIVKVPYFFLLPFKSYVIVFFQNATSLNFFSGMRNYFLYLKFRLFTRARKEETSGRPVSKLCSLMLQRRSLHKDRYWLNLMEIFIPFHLK